MCARRRGERGRPRKESSIAMTENEGRQLEFRLAEGGENGPELVIGERQDAPQRAPDGTFLPGNQIGKRTLTGEQREALEEIRQLAPKAADKMAKMLDDEEVPAAVKVKILEIILDRTYGKPEAALKLTTAQQSVNAAQERIAAIVSRIRIEG